MNSEDGKNRLVLGALCVIASALMFSFAGASIKMIGHSLSNETIVFWRNAISLAILAPWAYVNRKRWFHRHNLEHIAMWALAALMSLYCYYYAIAAIPLADAALLSFSAPIFVPVLGYLVFRFALDKGVVFAVLLGFLGVYLLLQPSTGVFETAALVGLLSGVFGGLAVVLLWRMTSTEHPGRMAFFFSLIGVAATIVPMSMSGEWPGGSDWIALLALGFCSTMAILLLALGCLIAPADRVITLDYSGVIFASTLGWLFWNEQPHLSLVIGGSLIIGAGIYAIRSKPRNVGTSSTKRVAIFDDVESVRSNSVV